MLLLYFLCRLCLTLGGAGLVVLLQRENGELRGCLCQRGFVSMYV